MRPLCPLVIAAVLTLSRQAAAQERGAPRLEVRRGWHRETIRGAGIGAGLGAIVGFVWSGQAASKSQPCRRPDLIEACYVDWYGKAFRGSLIGAAAGTALGAALGYTVKTERWGVSVAPLARGLELSVAF